LRKPLREVRRESGWGMDPQEIALAAKVKGMRRLGTSSCSTDDRKARSPRGRVEARPLFWYARNAAFPGALQSFSPAFSEGDLSVRGSREVQGKEKPAGLP
jgi:hypothetical protein